MMDEGYIKFDIRWNKTPPFQDPLLEYLNQHRQQLYRQQLIGAYTNGVGYGNISVRIGDTNRFYISGSKTGNFTVLTNQHYARVDQILIAKNRVYCSGPVVASSESMSHGVLYRQLNWISGVIHIHHLEFWKYLLNSVPATDEGASYGSPEMCHSIIHLLHKTNLPELKIFVMKEHREGIFAFGKSLEDTQKTLEKYWNEFQNEGEDIKN